jgi:hypothetical protein
MTELSDFELFVLICSTDKIDSKVTAVLEVALILSASVDT